MPPLLLPPEVQLLKDSNLEPSSSPEEAPNPGLEAAPLSPTLSPPEVVSLPTKELKLVISLPVVTMPEMEVVLMPHPLPPLHLKSMPALFSPLEPYCSSPETLKIGLNGVKSHFLTCPTALVAQPMALMDVVGS